MCWFETQNLSVKKDCTRAPKVLINSPDFILFYVFFSLRPEHVLISEFYWLPELLFHLELTGKGQSSSHPQAISTDVGVFRSPFPMTLHSHFLMCFGRFRKKSHVLPLPLISVSETFPKTLISWNGCDGLRAKVGRGTPVWLRTGETWPYRSVLFLSSDAEERD